MTFLNCIDQSLDTGLSFSQAQSNYRSQLDGGSPNFLVDSLQPAITSASSNVMNAASVSPGVKVQVTDFIGNTLPTAYDLGSLNGAQFRWEDSVNSTDPTDVYRIVLDNATRVSIELSRMSANANLFLVDSIGRTITSSSRNSNRNEVIERQLNAGVYYVRVESVAGANTSYDVNINVGGPSRDPGERFDTAYQLGNLSRRTWENNNFVGASDKNDFYRFDLSENGKFKLDLKSSSSNLVIGLYDRNRNFLTASTRAGVLTEAIEQNLAAGTYYIRIYPVISDNRYELRISTETPTYAGSRTLTGTLGADQFDFSGNYTRTIISGNGNVDFGTGKRDWLDLSTLNSTSVSINYANTKGGGVFYNPGNGSRLFDSIILRDGRQILFEGIDQIKFSDRVINLSVIPNDPLFNQQWHLGMMNVPNAWRFTTGASQVMVGVQDSGLALNAQGGFPSDLHWIWYHTGNNYGEDFFNANRNEPTIFSHGTAVQSIIAADSNNGVGMSGINWNSDFYVIDVLEGNSRDYTLAQATTIIADFARSREQRLVMNLSLVSDDPTFEQVVAEHPNVLFVIAAGNAGHLGIPGIAAPASLAKTYSNVMAIGAAWGRFDVSGNTVSLGDRIQYPGIWGSQYGDGLTLMGPSEVLAQAATRVPGGQTAFDYTPRFDGTSAATPNITGVASLVWSVNPTLTAAQVRQILSETATDLGQPGYDPFYGHGFVNADAAVRRAIALGASDT